MDQEDDRSRRRADQRDKNVGKLRNLEKEAVDLGTKLKVRDRLKAAFHLRNAWKKANTAGLRKEDFQDMIFKGLKRQHGKRQEFRLQNWILGRGEDPTTQDLTDKYKSKSTPQKSLEPYLVGITTAAQHCGADPDDWKLDMMHDLTIWSLPEGQPEVEPPDDRPAETLAILINVRCSQVGSRNKLGDTFDAIRRMNCRWEMFGERLVSTDATCMQLVESPISPFCEDCLYFEEMFPFPSVPLLRVPYAHGKRAFTLESQNFPQINETKRLVSESDPIENVPEGAPGKKLAEGYLAWYREIRLCIVPDGHGGYAGALETRPYLEVRFPVSSEFAGQHHVLGACDVERLDAVFLSTDGGYIGPHIHAGDGKVWWLNYQPPPDGDNQIGEWTERSSKTKNPLFDNNPGIKTTGWIFDADPVGCPGELIGETWYLSYTPATAPYLRHWLTKDWQLEGEPAVCLWDRSNFNSYEADSVWNRNLPPIHELNFPGSSSATWIECCLHNGLIEEALQASIDNLSEQTRRLQAEWHSARERHSNALLRRWNTEFKEKDTSNDPHL